MSDHFVSVAVMIDDLRGADREARLVAMRALLTIALTLGPERTREELLPYITDYLDEDDEVLRAMASCLGVMVDEVGGVAHVQCLLQPLELLCTLDEVTVRDAAVAALVQLGKKILPPGGSAARGGGDATAAAAAAAASPLPLFVAVTTRLGESEHPQSRCSAAGLVGVWYSAAASAAARGDAKAFFGKLCDDPEVMVRRAACVALGGPLAEALQAGVADLIPALVKLGRDASDSVRLQVVPAAIGVAARVDDAQLGPVVQVLRALGGDPGWRVRFMLADRLGAVAAALPLRDVGVAAALFTALCGDAAPEIRASVVHTVDAVAKVVPPASKVEVVQAACKLADDANPHVRACVAASLLRAAPHTPSTVWSALLIPTCTRLLRDSEAPVRLGIVTSFSSMAAAAAATGAETAGLAGVATALVPAVVSLIRDASWRVRESVLDEIPGIVQSGAAGTDDLVAVCTGALLDRVASIRAAAAAALCKLFERRGPEWGTATLMPALAPMATAHGFVQRVTVLHVLRLLIDVADAGFTRAEILPLTARLAADPIGNVRTGAAHVIRAALTKRKAAPGDVESVVAALKADTDVDVRDVMTLPAAPKK